MINWDMVPMRYAFHKKDQLHSFTCTEGLLRGLCAAHADRWTALQEAKAQALVLLQENHQLELIAVIPMTAHETAVETPMLVVTDDERPISSVLVVHETTPA